MTNISLNILNTINEESRQLKENCISSRKKKNINNLTEAPNPENEEKNKVIRQALKGPKSMRKNREALKKMGITASDLNYDYDKYGDEDDLIYGSTVHLRGSNGKSLSVDPDGTNVWHTAGDSRDHYKKELNYKDRHSKHYTGTSNIDFNSERGKAFDYYNYLTKPENKYQDEVDKANKAKKYNDNEGKTGYNLPDEALTPEEKSLNKRPRKYVELKKDKEELEDKLAGYEEDKNKLDQINKDIKGLHEDEELEKSKDIKSLAESIKNILSQCGASISYVNYREAIEDTKFYENNEISLSCNVKPDKISKTENEIEIYGTLVFDKDLNLVEAELRTGSGPNILNYSFIKCLNALYGYFSSGNKHYDL